MMMLIWLIGITRVEERDGQKREARPGGSAPLPWETDFLCPLGSQTSPHPHLREKELPCPTNHGKFHIFADEISAWNWLDYTAVSAAVFGRGRVNYHWWSANQSFILQAFATHIYDNASCRQVLRKSCVPLPAPQQWEENETKGAGLRAPAWFSQCQN